MNQALPVREPLNEAVLAPTGITAFACQDYAGAFASAVVQEGFTIVGKVEQEDDFGMPAWMHNASFLARGSGDFVHKSGDQASWPTRRVSVVFGNPPCSGFSVLTRSAKWQEAGLSGVEARQNHCMYDLIDHAVRCAAEVVVFESVQAASTTGARLMQELHRRLEERTGKHWHLTSVLMNAMSVGGWPDRRRFFFVASRRGPVDMPAATGMSRPLSECIGDLVDAVDDDPISPFSLVKTPKALRHGKLAEFHWPQGMPCSQAFEQAEKLGYTGPPPDRSDRILNQFTSARWKWDAPARVVTGGVMDTAVHPIMPRTFTHAEIGRMMGFPSNYDLTGITKMKGAGRALYGKGIPAQSGRWVMEGVRRHLLNMSMKSDIEPTPVGTSGFLWSVDVTSFWRGNRFATWEQPELFADGVGT
jgi:site-specific DNA-cytosine methylase